MPSRVSNGRRRCANGNVLLTTDLSRLMVAGFLLPNSRRIGDEMNAIIHDVGAEADVASLHTSIEQLIEYLREHFRTEEPFMDGCRFVAAREHKREHYRLLKDLACLARGEPRQAVGLTMQFLYRW